MSAAAPSQVDQSVESSLPDLVKMALARLNWADTYFLQSSVCSIAWFGVLHPKGLVANSSAVWLLHG